MVQNSLCMSICSIWKMQHPSAHIRESMVCVTLIWGCKIQGTSSFTCWMTWKSGKRSIKQAVTLLHHRPFRRQVCLSFAIHYHRPRECGTWHFTFFSRTGWWLSTISFNPSHLSTVPNDQALGVFAACFFDACLTFMTDERTVCDKSSHSQTCATDSPGGFVKTWIARPILRVSDLVGLEWLTSSLMMRTLQVQGLLFENHCMRLAHRLWWWWNLGQGVEGSSALPVLFFSIQNSWGKQGVKNWSSGYEVKWCVCVEEVFIMDLLHNCRIPGFSACFTPKFPTCCKEMV